MSRVFRVVPTRFFTLKEEVFVNYSASVETTRNSTTVYWANQRGWNKGSSRERKKISHFAVSRFASHTGLIQTRLSRHTWRMGRTCMWPIIWAGTCHPNISPVWTGTCSHMTVTQYTLKQSIHKTGLNAQDTAIGEENQKTDQQVAARDPLVNDGRIHTAGRRTLQKMSGLWWCSPSTCSWSLVNQSLASNAL